MKDDHEYEVYEELGWKHIVGAFAAIIALIVVLFAVLTA